MRSWNCAPVDNWRSASRLWISHGDGSRRPGGGAAFAGLVGGGCETGVAFAGLVGGGCETGVAFAGVVGAARETGVAFAGVNGPVLGGWSRALVSRVSSASVGRRALVLWVSCRAVWGLVVVRSVVFVGRW